MEDPSPASQSESSKPPPSERERSTIEFPYTDLDSAIEVVTGVHNAGGTACDYDQLAAQLSMEARGGGFRNRVLGAKTFGLLSYERGGRITLTQLGREIIDQVTEKQAKVDAFLAVPLYARIFEQFKGSPLPPQTALQRAIEAAGVGTKVSDRARQVLMRSAKQAGFFESAADRLVKPPIRNGTNNHRDTPGDEPEKPRNRRGSEDGAEHPLITGLIQTLPEAGTQWNAEDRLNWLRMADSIFKMIYKREPGEDEITLDLKAKESPTQ